MIENGTFEAKLVRLVRSSDNKDLELDISLLVLGLLDRVLIVPVELPRVHVSHLVGALALADTCERERPIAATSTIIFTITLVIVARLEPDHLFAAIFRVDDPLVASGAVLMRDELLLAAHAQGQAFVFELLHSLLFIQAI